MEFYLAPRVALAIIGLVWLLIKSSNRGGSRGSM